MATTWPGTVKELVAGIAALDGRVYREGHDLEGATLPYLTVFDPVSETPGLRGDATTLGRFRDTQVDLWQDVTAEDDTLVAAVRDALDGAKAMGARVTVTQTIRVPEPVDSGLAHHAFTARAGGAM